MASPIMGRPVSEEVWEAVRTEFALPTVEQVRRRLAELMEDPAPVMRQLVRVFLSGLLRSGWFRLAVCGEGLGVDPGVWVGVCNRECLQSSFMQKVRDAFLGPSNVDRIGIDVVTHAPTLIRWPPVQTPAE